MKRYLKELAKAEEERAVKMSNGNEIAKVMDYPVARLAKQRIDRILAMVEHGAVSDHEAAEAIVSAYDKVSAEIWDIVHRMEHWYEWLYNREEDTERKDRIKSEMMEFYDAGKCDKLYVQATIECRQDFISSDREAAAYSA